MDVDTFVLIARYFWVLFIAVTCINGAIFHLRARRESREHPELAAGYATLVRGWFFWGNLPWMVMGLGVVIGGVPTVFHFFVPRQGDPWVLVWFASSIVVYVLGTFWIFLRGGAEMLARHYGLFSGSVRSTSPTVVKTYYLSMLVPGIVAMVVMFSWNPPLPFP